MDTNTAPPSTVDLPPGLDRALMLILSRHIWRLNSISRLQLCTALQDFHLTDRQLRQQVKALRRQGNLIGSVSGANGGFYLIISLDEFNEFIQSEYLLKVQDMTETARLMARTAQRQWGADSVQLILY